jgi:hypothetical protein
MEVFQTSATEEQNGHLGSVAASPPQRGPLSSFEKDRDRERKDNQM